MSVQPENSKWNNVENGNEMDILRPLTDAEVNELLAMYYEKYGGNDYQYLMLYNQCKWNRQLAAIGFGQVIAGQKDDWQPFRKTFYTHQLGDFRKYGTYVSIHYDVLQSVSFHSWQEPDRQELFECLRETKLIKWSSSPLLTNVDLNICDRVKELAVSKGVFVERARSCCLLVLKHEKALQLQVGVLPPEYYLAPLEEKHAELINMDNKKEGSVQYVKSLTIINKTIGIYRSADKELIAWVFQNDFAGLGFLQVLPEYQRQGFGLVLVTALSKQIAETENVDVTAYILVENFKSEGLLEKVGFVKSQWNEWIQLRKIE